MLTLCHSPAHATRHAPGEQGAVPRRSASAGHTRFAPSVVALRAQRSRRGPRPAAAAVGAGKAEAAQASAGGKEELYEVFLQKPLGIKFARGRDGGAYVAQVDPAAGAVAADVQPGDKVVRVSASFGADVWDALNFGQVVYAIKTRNGEVYLQLRRNYGDLTQLEEETLTEAERRFKEERGGGNYGSGTKELQARNYVARKEADRARRELFDDALTKFRGGKIEEALIDFENVLGLEPKNYLGDDFSRVTQVYRVTQYNVACCYATLGQLDAGLEALRLALASGFEDYPKVRQDPNLAGLRSSPKFKQLIDQYDEPLLNEGAIKALKSIFSFGKKN